MCVLIMRQNRLLYEEIYTASKNFTLPPAVLAVTNLTSGAGPNTSGVTAQMLAMFLQMIYN